jgi:hypothetical protein
VVIPTDRDKWFATSAIRQRSDATISRNFWLGLRQNAVFACNPTDRETWFAMYTIQIDEPPTILLNFGFVSARLLVS